MKTIRIIKIGITITCFSSFFSSCDYFQHGSGIVIDDISRKPLDSVFVEAYLTKKEEGAFINQMYTDTTGKFEIGTGNMSRESSKMDFIFLLSKPGYYNVVINRPLNDTIYLKKINTKRVYLDKIYRR